MIHAVDPVWHDGEHGEPDLLAGCYRRVLELAHESQCRSIAFPAISCGVFHFPAPQAVKIAVSTVIDTLRAVPALEHVIFACFDAAMLRLYEAELAR